MSFLRTVLPLLALVSSTTTACIMTNPACVTTPKQVTVPAASVPVSLAGVSSTATSCDVQFSGRQTNGFARDSVAVSCKSSDAMYVSYVVLLPAWSSNGKYELNEDVFADVQSRSSYSAKTSPTPVAWRQVPIHVSGTLEVKDLRGTFSSTGPSRDLSASLSFVLTSSAGSVPADEVKGTPSASVGAATISTSTTVTREQFVDSCTP